MKKVIGWLTIFCYSVFVCSVTVRADSFDAIVDTTTTIITEALTGYIPSLITRALPFGVLGFFIGMIVNIAYTPRLLVGQHYVDQGTVTPDTRDMSTSPPPGAENIRGRNRSRATSPVN